MLGIHRFAGGVATAILAFVPGVTLAAFISIEPDDFAAGTDVSHAIAGVTLSTWSNVNNNGFFEFRPVGISHDQSCIDNPIACQAVTGSKYFSGPGFISENWGIARIASCFGNAAIRAGTAQCGSGYANSYGMNALVVQFDDPTDFFSISGRWQADHVEAYAFDANFNLVGSSQNILDYTACRALTSYYCSNTVTQTSATPLISYVLAGSWAGGAKLDAIIFNDSSGQSVPEPGTLSLLGLGLLGLGAMKRRKAHCS